MSPYVRYQLNHILQYFITCVIENYDNTRLSVERFTHFKAKYHPNQA